LSDARPPRLHFRQQLISVSPPARAPVTEMARSAQLALGVGSARRMRRFVALVPAERVSGGVRRQEALLASGWAETERKSQARRGLAVIGAAGGLPPGTPRAYGCIGLPKILPQIFGAAPREPRLRIPGPLLQFS